MFADSAPKHLEEMLTRLLFYGVISSMQSSKASKKTKIAEETVAPVPETSTSAESTANPRSSRSSKLKKETSDMGPAKHRKNSSPETIVDSSRAVKTTSAGAGSSSVEAPIIDSVGVMSPSNEEIAKLAHSYWIARGHAHGSAEEDWLRAEQELKAKR